MLEGGYDLDALRMSTASTLASLVDVSHRPERATSASAAMLGRTALEVHADEQDEVSPAADARAIAAACPGASLHLTRGVAHADLGTAPSGVRVQA